MKLYRIHYTRTTRRGTRPAFNDQIADSKEEALQAFRMYHDETPESIEDRTTPAAVEMSLEEALYEIERLKTALAAARRQ